MKTIEKYSVAYAEVLEVLKYISLDDYEKIPKKYITFMEENADENSLFEYNVAVPFDKQDISEDAKNVLAMLFRLFIIDDDKKQELSKNDAMIEENYQKEIKEKYDPDNLFKKSNVENVKKEVALVEVKEEKWYQKILTFFRKLFRK